jgi:hypothetical protein
MSSQNINNTLQTRQHAGRVGAIALPSEDLSILTTQILSTGLIIILVLVLIINVALIA